MTREDFPKLLTSITGIDNSKHNSKITMDFYDDYLAIKNKTLIIKDLRGSVAIVNNKGIDLSSFKEIILQDVRVGSIVIKHLTDIRIIINRCEFTRLRFDKVDDCDLQLYDYLQSGTEAKSIVFNESVLNSFKIERFTPYDNKKLTIKKGFYKLSSNKPVLNKLEIKYVDFDNLNINFLDVIELSFYITNVKILKFYDCSISNMSFESIKVFEEFEFIFLNPYLLESVKNFIKLKYCEINNDVIFEACDLREYIFNLISSDIRNSKFSATLLSSKVDDSNSDNQQQDTIFQLRKFAESINDNYTLHKIKSLEHEINYKLLKFKNSKLDIIVLFFDKFSTNFGRNWIYPVLWYLGLGALIYWSIASLNCQDFNPNSYAIFLNPTHKITSVFGEIKDLHPATGLLDYGTRIFFAYLAVQTVTAFRKILK